MLAHLTHRTFVLPDHLSTELGHLEGKSSVSDFFCFGGVGRWVPVISMQQYLDDRHAASVASAMAACEAVAVRIRSLSYSDVVVHQTHQLSAATRQRQFLYRGVSGQLS